MNKLHKKWRIRMNKRNQNFFIIFLIVLSFISCSKEQGIIEGDNVKLISGKAIVGFIRWSKDGKYGVYDEYGRIWLLNLNKPIGKDNPVALTNEKALAITPSWSLDSKYIVFSYKPNREDRETPTNIWMMSIDGNVFKQLTFFDKDVREPEWIDEKTLSFKDASYRLYIRVME